MKTLPTNEIDKSISADEKYSERDPRETWSSGDKKTVGTCNGNIKKSQSRRNRKLFFVISNFLTFHLRSNQRPTKVHTYPFHVLIRRQIPSKNSDQSCLINYSFIGEPPMVFHLSARANIFLSFVAGS